jgi:hypothetical protein
MPVPVGVTLTGLVGSCGTLTASVALSAAVVGSNFTAIVHDELPPERHRFALTTFRVIRSPNHDHRDFPKVRRDAAGLNDNHIRLVHMTSTFRS